MSPEESGPDPVPESEEEEKIEGIKPPPPPPAPAPAAVGDRPPPEVDQSTLDELARGVGPSPHTATEATILEDAEQRRLTSMFEYENALEKRERRTLIARIVGGIAQPQGGNQGQSAKEIVARAKSLVDEIFVQEA